MGAADPIYRVLRPGRRISSDSGFYHQRAGLCSPKPCHRLLYFAIYHYSAVISLIGGPAFAILIGLVISCSLLLGTGADGSGAATSTGIRQKLMGYNGTAIGRNVVPLHEGGKSW